MSMRRETTNWLEWRSLEAWDDIALEYGREVLEDSIPRTTLFLPDGSVVVKRRRIGY